ncbi:MAG: CusA/CzcA family heavy metal efflux RND transporter [Candidatus Coatesbacteria bacterium]
MRTDSPAPREGLIERTIDFSARNRFATLAGVGLVALVSLVMLRRIPLDAIPDLSDTQVVIYSEWMRSPDVIEDQLTYPIVTALLGAPKVKAVRGVSDFGFSYVYVIFEDGTDVYWARSRVLEYLSGIQGTLPPGVKTRLGPDATGVGWVFQYALKDPTGRWNLAQLRSLQDWYLRYLLQSVPGVAEVSTVGGFVRQYQIEVNPDALFSYGIGLMQVVAAVRASNQETGGRLIELGGAEYMIRGRGYVKSAADLDRIAVGFNPATGTPVLVRDVARVSLGPDVRRGVAELDGEGEVVGGIVTMRYGENALKVIERIKARIEELRPSLPKGVELVTVYDRSELINESVTTVSRELAWEIVFVSIVIFLFLLHIPSALIPIVTIPFAVLISFLPMGWLHVTSNIMSLGGIAVAIGDLVDGAIALVDNVHKKTERWRTSGRREEYREVVIAAIKEIGRPMFFSLLVIAVSFLPIFALEAQEGRLFKPLAFTKIFSILMGALLAITLDPAVRLLFTRQTEYRFRPAWLCRIVNAVVVGKLLDEERHPVSRFLFRVYEPAVRFVLARRRATIAVAALLVFATLPVFLRLGSEFMPPLWEGSLLYMPTTLPGISVAEAARQLALQDRRIRKIPEVTRVFGKVGRAGTSLDPAPYSMVETTILLRPKDEWRRGLTEEGLKAELDMAMQLPGWINAWTMPIKNRIDMLSTGVRTPIGIKVLGSRLEDLERIAIAVEQAVRTVPGTRSALAERATGGYFLDIDIDRDAIARYGLSVDDVQMTIETAIGGDPVTTTVEGRERYTVSVRYPRELRGDPDAIARVLVATMDGRQIPLGELAAISLKTGASMLRNENGLLAAYVFVDFTDPDIGGYVARAKRAVAEQVRLPAGTTLLWSGQYEYMQRVAKRLKLVVPITLSIVFFIIYLSTRSLVKTSIVLLAVPFSAIGTIWLLWALDYNMSIAVWVGIISLLGLDAETGMFMLLYLDLAHKDRQDRGKLQTLADLNEAVVYGAVRRIRPKLMMVAVNFIGLLPVMLGTGTGAETMKRVAAPMVGGLFTSLILELLVYPAVYSLWRERQLPGTGARPPRRNGNGGGAEPLVPVRVRELIASARGKPGRG